MYKHFPLIDSKMLFPLIMYKKDFLSTRDKIQGGYGGEQPPTGFIARKNIKTISYPQLLALMGASEKGIQNHCNRRTWDLEN